jgi:hypothetical protein
MDPVNSDPRKTKLPPDVEQMLNDVERAATAVRAKVGKLRGVAGELDCPVCKTGKLRYRVSARNGHIAAGCTTDGCVSWME